MGWLDIDPAAIQRFREYLPQIDMVMITHSMHGEYVMMHPKELAAQVLAFVEKQ